MGLFLIRKVMRAKSQDALNLTTRTRAKEEELDGDPVNFIDKTKIIQSS